MLVKANQTFEVTKEATVRTLGGKIMRGARIATLVPPKKGDDGRDKILVHYDGLGRGGECRNGKFWINVESLARHARKIG